MFTEYVSNLSSGTGANYLIDLKAKSTFTRCYMRPLVCGRYRYRFFFSNFVDSTYDQGDVAHVGMSGRYHILSASVSVCPIPEMGYRREEGIEQFAPLTDTKTVTFSGERGKRVEPGEMFWSDAVEVDVPEGHYLVWEAQLLGGRVPCTPDSQIPCFVDHTDSMSEQAHAYQTDDFCPKPMLVGCDRKVKKRIAFWGDSITQGCGTDVDCYNMWVGQIARMLKEEYAVWNLGMGWGRGSDADQSESWLYKAAQNDIVVMTFGVNDLLHGAYGIGRSNTAGEIVCTLESLIGKLQSRGVEVILSTVPPFEFTKAQQKEWRALNLAIPQIAKLHGCRVFDLESALDGGEDLANDFSVYGAHPDGRGGKAAAEKFYETFHTENGWAL